MSARMISLAVNIALMGFILLEGVRASLAAASPAGTDAASLKAIAEQVAAGTTPPIEAGVPAAVVHQALADGMGGVLLFGGVSVWVFALASWLAFRSEAAPGSHRP